KYRQPPYIHPLSLHDALPISRRKLPYASNSESIEWRRRRDEAWTNRGAALHAARAYEDAGGLRPDAGKGCGDRLSGGASVGHGRSEEHTSELQSRENLVCRLL